MPKLPSAEDYGYAPPRPSRELTTIRPDQGHAGMAAAAQGLESFAHEVGALAKAETERLEELAAQNAHTELERKKLEMTWNPEKGFKHIQGDAVLARPLTKEIPEAFDKEIADRLAGLKTPRAQALFKQFAERSKTGLLTDLYHHVGIQTEAAKDQGEKSRLALAFDKVAADPTLLPGAIAEAENVLAGSFARRGIADPNIAGAAVAAEREKLISAALKAHLAGDNPNTAAAEAVVERYKDILPRATVETALEHIHKHEDFGLATAIATNLREQYAQGAKVTELFDQLNASVEGRRPETRELAKRMLGEAMHAVDADQESATGVLTNRFAESKTVKTRFDILKSPEYTALRPEKQTKLIEYMESELRQQDAERRQRKAETRAEHVLNKAERAERYDVPAVWAEFHKYADDINWLGTATDGQIQALIPKLGEDNVKTLFKKRIQVQSAAGKFQFDKDVLGEALAAAGVPKGAKSAAQGLIEHKLIAWKEANPGKLPTPAEQQWIVSDALAPHVKAGHMFNTEKKPWEVLSDPDSKERMFVHGKLGNRMVPKEAPDSFVNAILSVSPKALDSYIKGRWDALREPPKDFAAQAREHAAKKGIVDVEDYLRRAWAIRRDVEASRAPAAKKPNIKK